jgi:hypothetical protein
MSSLRRNASLFTLAVLALTACGDDGATPPAQLTPRGIAVLDGFIQPGLTLVPDSGTVTQRIIFGTSNDFDAGTFEVRNDTAVAASSRGAGDLLYIADLRTAAVRRIQMPARSNPARARLLRGAGGRALIGVPLRDSSSVILASVASSGQTSFERINDLGTCPADVFQHGNDIWVVDANATCATNYTPIGGMRLIRIPGGGGTRQVIALPELRGSDADVVVLGDVAYISAGGDADFSSFPFTIRAGGAITRVDLRTASVLGARSMPAGTYGASAKLGLDGNLQVTILEDLVNFRSRTISYRLPDLTPVGTRVTGADWLALRDAAGAQVSCGSSLMDGLGRLHCIQNRTGSATFLMVFAPGGDLVREVAAGQGGVDLRFR